MCCSSLLLLCQLAVVRKQTASSTFQSVGEPVRPAVPHDNKCEYFRS